MKKFFGVFMILLMACSVPYRIASADTLKPMDNFYVNDYADVVDGDVEDAIIQYGNKLEEETGAQIVLVTIDFTGGESLEEYALKLFNEWGIGSEEKNNGLLILLSIGDDDYWVMQGEGLEDTLTSGKISDILQEYLEPDFAAKDYSAGAEKIYEAFFEELGGQLPDKPDIAEEDSNLKDGQYVFDYSDVISNDAEVYINKKSSQSIEARNAGFYVVTKDNCDKELSFKEDTINTFEELNIGSRGILLVLYIKDDNYWLLPGSESEAKFASEEKLQNILDKFLEPEFAAKDYGQGVIDTADKFYDLFIGYYGMIVSKDKPIHLTEEDKPIVLFFAFLFIIILLVLASKARRRRYRNIYDDSYNSYGYRRQRWGGRGWNSGPSHHESESSSSHGGFWGSSGGAGRSTSHSSSFGGGGSSRGGGAGRSSHSSSGGSGFSGGGRSSGGGGGRSSSGGGGSSRGGGAGRHK